jgi:hypothetical protein
MDQDGSAVGVGESHRTSCGSAGPMPASMRLYDTDLVVVNPFSIDKSISCAMLP